MVWNNNNLNTFKGKNKLKNNLNHFPPEVWIDSLIYDLLHLEIGIKYKISDLEWVANNNQNREEAYCYLQKIEIIKNKKKLITIDSESEENNKRLNQFVINIAPSIEILNKYFFTITESLFYENLDDAQKVLLFISQNYKYPYSNMKIPERFKTEHFYDYMNIYYCNSWGANYFSISELGQQMISRINKIISEIYKETINMTEGISQIAKASFARLNQNRRKAAAFTKINKS